MEAAAEGWVILGGRMSRENVDLALLMYEAFNRRDLDRFLALMEVEEIIDLDDKALGITRWHAVPSDAPKVDWLWCHLVSFREGLISEARSFLDKRGALQAAGLPE